jgi:A/G-specific adenine glycosylase
VSRPEPARGAAPGDFARRLVAWHRRHGRHDLPWQKDRDPYRVWLSEIMLQQTQVATVLPYYARFLQRLPTVADLARAPVDEVMALWAGLGYYARARNLHACAQRVVQQHGGRFPATAEALGRLPGIGPSTAAAIAAFCHDQRGAILDGNVKRVLARHWAIEGHAGQAGVARILWDRARLELPPAASVARYTQAVMDLGATVCTRASPACERCPVAESCEARRQGRQGELPAGRPPRERPLRTAHVLVALSGRSVLLHKRAPEGIWGGLVCLPQFESLAALKRAAQSLGTGKARLEAMPPRRHELTHLSLAIKAYRLQPPHAARAAGLDAAAWFTLEDAGRAGMPVPHRRLLAEAVADRARAGRGRTAR